MKEEEKIEPYHQNDAKQIVDTLFEAKLFREDIKRDGMQEVEDLLAFYFQSRAQSIARGLKWSAAFKKVYPK